MTHLNLLAVAVAGLVLAGCSSTPTEEGSKTTVAPSVPVVGAAAAYDSSKNVGDKVYFDFDRSDIKAEYVSVIKAQAASLKASGKAVTLEGHCDERGTREYNLALGERRAKSVADALMANGVSAASIKTVSFGEDRAAMEGHDESAWSKNRRVEFMVK